MSVMYPEAYSSTWAARQVTVMLEGGRTRLWRPDGRCPGRKGQLLLNVMQEPCPVWADRDVFKEKPGFDFFFREITQYWQLIKTFFFLKKKENTR